VSPSTDLHGPLFCSSGRGAAADRLQLDSGIDFAKLHFGQIVFRQNLYLNYIQNAFNCNGLIFGFSGSKKQQNKLNIFSFGTLYTQFTSVNFGRNGFIKSTPGLVPELEPADEQPSSAEKHDG
jgi:hypothetical protein